MFTAQREICMYMGDSNRTPGLAQAQDEVQRRLLLNVVVGERAAVLELLARKDQALLVRRNSLLVLNPRLDILDSVATLDLGDDGLASQRPHKNLHIVHKHAASKIAVRIRDMKIVYVHLLFQVGDASDENGQTIHTQQLIVAS